MAAPVSSPDNYIDLRRIWYCAKDHRVFIALTMILALSGAGAYTALSRPTYRAKASILIENQTATIVNNANTGIGLSREVTQAQRELALSLPVLTRACEKLKTGEWEEVRDSETQDPLLPLKEKNASATVAGQLLVLWTIHPQPHKAADLANAWVDAFVEEMNERERSSSVYTKEFLQREIPELRENWLQKQTALHEFQRESKYDPNEARTNPVRERYSELSKRLTEAQVKLSELESEAQGWAGSQDDIAKLLQHPRARNDPNILALGKQVLDLRVETIRIQQKFHKGSAIERKAAESLAEIEAVARKALQAIGEQIAVERSVFQRRYDQLKEMHRAAETEYEALKSKEDRYQVLAFELEMARRQYEELAQRQQEADVEGRVNYSYARKWERATPPVEIYRPSLPLNVAIGLLLGIMVSVLGVVLLEATNSQVRNAGAFESVTGCHVAANVPIVPRKWRSRSLHLAHYYPKAPAVEALRSLRTNLIMTHRPQKNAERACCTIMLTSATEGEGKTMLSSNLSFLLAQAGYRVLLVDSDLHKATLTRELNLKDRPGLGNLIGNDRDLSNILNASEHSSLKILGAGTPAKDPAALLQSDLLVGLLQEAKRQFDFVILDAPPVLAVSDAFPLMLHSDVVLSVVRSRYVQQSQAERALEMIIRLSGKQPMVVLNAVRDIDLAESGYSYGYRSPTKRRGEAVDPSSSVA